MKGATLAKRLVDNWPFGLAVALALAFIPLANWLGVILAVVILLRQGGLWTSLGYVLIAMVAYFTSAGFSLSLLTQEWGAVLIIFGPLWLMGSVLRELRSLSLALLSGTLSFMVLILLMRLIEGPSTLETWLGYFNCRLEAAGLSQAQMMDVFPGHDFNEAVKAFMLGWPLSVSLLQVGLLFAARWVQSLCYYPGGFGNDFRGLKQPKTLALGAAGLLVIAGFAPENMVTLIHLGILALVLMGVTGLGMVHAHLKAKKMSAWWLILVYGILLLNTWVALLLLATLGTVGSVKDNFILSKRG